MKRVLCVLVVLGVCGGALSHTYHLGACPVVEPMPGFEMNKALEIGYLKDLQSFTLELFNTSIIMSPRRVAVTPLYRPYRDLVRGTELIKFLGIWYVIQKTSTASHCITYNFTKTAEPGKYELEQISQHFILGLTPLKHEYKYKGTLTIPDWSVQAKMTVNFPLSVAGTASYVVVATDYSSYASVFTCQKLAFAHRRSATILSRTKDLDKIYTDKMRSKLSTFGVDPFDLSIISQKECPHPEKGDGVNINIDPETFSSHNIGEAVRKTGGAIANGVEYVVEAGKTVYHKVASSKEDLTETPARENRNLEMDAEWLP